MNKHETDAFRRSNVRSRMYQPAAMLVHGIASMPAKNAGALMAVVGIEDAVPLIHGPAGCASLRQMNGGRIFAAGDPESVLTVENIRRAYGVEALVKSDGERPYIIPVRPIGSSGN